MEPEDSKLEARRMTPSAHQPVASRRKQYLVAKRPGLRPAGVEPLDFSAVRTALEQDPDTKIKRTLTAPGLGPLAAGLAGGDSIIVAEMPTERAEQMSRVAQLIVEPDHPLMLELEEPVPRCVPNPGVVAAPSTTTSVTIRVLDTGDKPVEQARVFLVGSFWPAQGVTDADGQARITLFGESLDSIRHLYVIPRADYWSAWLPEPVLDVNGPNTIVLTPLDRSFPNFPDQEVVGWGLGAMRLDQLPANYRGQGVKVAVIDSGVATNHQDLQSVVEDGYDSITPNAGTWSRDEIGHGSHCAGIIAAAGSGKGVRGIAPEAEIYVLKVSPDGRFSNLIDALNRCIEWQVDVVNLSLGSDHYSQLVDEKLREAKELGIACIASAGSSAAAVQFPASSPSVLAVAAIGKKGEFPDESFHATAVLDGSAASDGYFAARFSCSGPEVDLCAPGVAILSCVPPNDYAVWDGSSMAAPHVTGLAALLLAHHPDFQGAYKARNARRVERLFQILQQTARPLNLGDRNRTGAGLPDAVNAFAGVRPGEGEVLSEELLQRLVTALLGGQTRRPGNGAAAFQQLLGALQRAGLGTTGGPGATQQPGPLVAGTPTAMRAPGPATPGQDPAAVLQQLRDAMREAGLLTAKQAAAAAKGWRPPANWTQSPATGRPASPSGVDGVQARQLTEKMKQAGLL